LRVRLGDEFAEPSARRRAERAKAPFKNEADLTRLVGVRYDFLDLGEECSAVSPNHAVVRATLP
jgi:hypothetical protein